MKTPHFSYISQSVPRLLVLAGLATTLSIAVAQSPTVDRNLLVESATRGSANGVQSQQRIALVIGNASYKDAPLLNPVNDARAIAAALRETGFQVIARENADHRAMSAALREFGDKLKAGGTGLFYYAGHGMQIKGRNFLIPVGANVEREDEVAYSALDAQAVLDKMEAAGNGMNIMILDACRNNPFTRSTRSGQAGLAQMDAPVGTLVAFATSPGAVASDGAGANGLYTQHFLQAMKLDNAKIEDVFKQVRANVRRESQGKQIPWEATSLEGDFYFKRLGQTVAPVVASATNSGAVPAKSTGDKPNNASVNMPPAAKPIVPVPSAAPRPAAESLSEAARLKDEALREMDKQPARPLPAPSSSKKPPLSNAYGFTVGDRWRYQTVDKFKKEVVSNWSRTVSGFNEDGSIRVNGNDVQWTAQGALLKWRISGDRTRINTIGYGGIPSELKVGTSRDYKEIGVIRYADGQERKFDTNGSFKTVARERIQVPAGEFDTWRIEFSGYFGNTKVKEVFWYVPALRNNVASEYEERDRNGNIESFVRQELTSYSVRGADEALALGK